MKSGGAKFFLIPLGALQKIIQKHCYRVKFNGKAKNRKLLPIDGDLNGYLSGRSTLTFHTPPSYGAARNINDHVYRAWTHNTKSLG